MQRLANAAPTQFSEFVFHLQGFNDETAKALIYSNQSELQVRQGAAQMLYGLLLCFEKCMRPGAANAGN
jgi:hypothetical protein